MAITVLTIAVTCATARAAGFIQIVPVGEAAPQVINLSQLPGGPDVTSRTYLTVATPRGAPRPVTVRSGYSLPKLFAAIRISAGSFESAEVIAPAGPSVVLTSTEATIPGAYMGGLPVVWQDGAGAHFLVPSRPTGKTNAGETFVGSGGTITIKLHRGLPLYLGISGPPTAFVGKPVQFYSSSVFGAASPRYQWSFGDGTTGSQAEPTHIYAGAGIYNVYLQVAGGNDSVGASSVIHVAVGNPPKRPNRSGSGTGGSGTGASGSAGAQGSGTGRGSGTGSLGTARAPAGRGPVKRTVPRPTKQAPRPVGPLISGTAISYVGQPAHGVSAGAAGSSAGARSGQLSTGGAGAVGQSLLIALGALGMLLGGALLEWNGPWRARPGMLKAR